MERKRRPEWLKIRLAGGREYGDIRRMMQRDNLNTVCQSARCPNIGDCRSRRTATFMILGDICTRNCRFCAVHSGRPGAVDAEEPERVAQAVARLKLRHAVITSVTRDDLPDGGAGLFAAVIEQVRKQVPGCSLEVLVPDFRGRRQALQTVFDARPDVFNHNLEVVPGLYSKARPQADFRQSLEILRLAKQNGFITKTGIMVGLGERREELLELFRKLAAIPLDILTIGQYLQPTARHLEVERYYHPDEFRELEELAESAGISRVASGPMVRSSYHADQQAAQFSRHA